MNTERPHRSLLTDHRLLQLPAKAALPLSMPLSVAGTRLWLFGQKPGGLPEERAGDVERALE